MLRPMARKTGGRLLRAWRESQRLTQDEMGRAIGKSGTYVRKLERGQLPFTVEIAVAVSQQTGIELGAFLSRDQMALLDSARALLRDPSGAAA